MKRDPATLTRDRSPVGATISVTRPASPAESGPALRVDEPAAWPPDDTVELPPSLHARFEDFELLGRGASGAVFRARDFRLGRDVAIKLLLGADPERGGGLLREVRSQARLSHENVCEVYEAGTADHARYIVMQLIRGDPLDRAKAGMTLEERVRAIRQIASALHEAHRLGLVHRDVKPSNIMVERGEDGAWKPYIMDFGLAREVGDSGRTMTGAILGTPAFMAPEQAAGKVRSLDRRTDVYGLGATLYDVLAGRPPFVAGSLLELLEQVRSREPAPLRDLDRDFPRDLEAIVMKCLEKEPSARYESARALGEDLQRFLDGDAVLARRGGLGYALLKRARRHRRAVALAGAALLAAALTAALWARGRRLAAEQATLSRELGESVKEMELFLRSAHGMPLHDIERERDVVRARLREIEARMAAAGEAGRGPGRYALGRGHLALQAPEAALDHLEQAAAAGYRSPGLDFAMGVALSAVYKRALEQADRIPDKARREELTRALEARLKQPALAHLRAALGGTIESPAYAEGLIALYEDRHEEALAKARQAFEEAPWLYEAKKLEGDVLFAIGSRHGHDAAFDHRAMTAWFQQAAEAYRIAADLGRSDPAVHDAACALWTQVMNGAFEHGDPVRPSFEEAIAACGRAIAASPGSPSGYVKLAWAHNCFAWRVATGAVPGEDPEAAIAEAIARAEEAARRSPEDLLARYVVGALWRTRALYASNRGLDVAPAVDHAIAGYQAVLRLAEGSDAALGQDQVFLWALNELCSSYLIRAERESLRGLDLRPSLEEALPRCDRALALDPTFVYPRNNKVIAQLLLARHLVAAGESPAAPIRAATEAIEAVAQVSASHRPIPSWRASLRLIEATWALESGADAEPALAAAEASVLELERLQPSSPVVHEPRGEAALLRARWLAARGEDPTPALREARAAFARAVEATPWYAKKRVWSAHTEIVALRWALREGQAKPAAFEAALAPLLPLLDAPSANPRLYLALAEIHELRAASRAGQKEAEEDIAEGLRRAEEALAINPRHTSALTCKERLLRLRASREARRSAGSSGAPEAPR